MLPGLLHVHEPLCSVSLDFVLFAVVVVVFGGGLFRVVVLVFGLFLGCFWVVFGLLLLLLPLLPRVVLVLDIFSCFYCLMVVVVVVVVVVCQCGPFCCRSSLAPFKWLLQALNEIL